MTRSAKLPDIPGGWTTRQVTLPEGTFELTVPAAPDDFLEDREVQMANARDDYMPYWPYLWPASLSMATAVMSVEWTPNRPVLELGCGIGLVGLAALAQGLDVTFSDYDRTAIKLAVYNARKNGFPNASSLLLDWRDPPQLEFPIILASDVLYESGNQSLILDVVATTLAGDGACWIGDPGRHETRSFFWKARERGFAVEIIDECGKPPANSSVGTRSMTGRFRILSLTRTLLPK